MKISIITVCYNSEKHIKNAIESVLSQTYNDIEYIVIDGGSTDKTNEIIDSYKAKISKYISEKDKGIYDAMNKGIRLATGDIVGILNSDDIFTDNTIVSQIANKFKDSDVDAIYGDVQFINPTTNKITRFYSSKNFTLAKFKFGFMPAHPSFYAKKELFIKYGFYKENYLISADFELLLRFIYIHKIKTAYINLIFVNMLSGGISTKSLKSKWILNTEIIKACRENGVYTNYLLISLKYFVKIFEFVIKK